MAPETRSNKSQEKEEEEEKYQEEGENKEDEEEKAKNDVELGSLDETKKDTFAQEEGGKGDGNRNKSDNEDSNEEDSPYLTRLYEVFKTYWYLGLIAFGGPQAHVAILRDHLLVQRNWMSEDAFMELFAIGQGLPGPTSTQLVVSTALARAGPVGGLMAFFLWNLPGLVVLTTCGVLISTFVDGDADVPPWFLVGLPPAAISLVFKAFYGFALKLDRLGVALALVSCIVAIIINGDKRIDPLSSQYIFPLLLVFGATVTFCDWKRAVGPDGSTIVKTTLGTYKPPSSGWNSNDDKLLRRIGIPLWVGAGLILLWAALLATSVSLVDKAGVTDPYLEIFEVMFRVGSLIYGGGQVVLPLLQTEVVPYWMSKDTFLQGLGLAQSMPGPLFNFASYLGAVYQSVGGAFVAYLGLFGPGIMLIFAVVPFWARMRHLGWFKAVLNGLNASAIGLVGAACVLLWEAAITTAADAAVFCFAGTLAVYWNIGAQWAILAGWCLGAVMSQEATGLGGRSWCVMSGYVLPP